MKIAKLHVPAPLVERNDSGANHMLYHRVEAMAYNISRRLGVETPPIPDIEEDDRGYFFKLEFDVPQEKIDSLPDGLRKLFVNE